VALLPGVDFGETLAKIWPKARLGENTVPIGWGFLANVGQELPEALG
jgi:hypothetical protein